MNLEDCPAPETDAVVQSAKSISGLIMHARDLERRLSLCREALEAIASRTPIMGSKDDYRIGQLHALNTCTCVALYALESTKPKP